MEFFECLGMSLVVFDGLFLKIVNPLYFGGCNFLNFNLFSTIFSASDVSIRGIQVLFGHQKQRSPPLESGLP